MLIESILSYKKEGCHFQTCFQDLAWGDHWDEAIGDKMELNPHIPKPEPEPPKEEEKKEEAEEKKDNKEEEKKEEEKEKVRRQLVEQHLVECQFAE